MALKKTLENISKSLPALLKNATDYLKTNFDENGKKIFENTGGTAGVVIGLLAQPMIDKYFDVLSKKKLENFGFNTYLKAALFQASKSLEVVEGKLDSTLSPNLVFSVLQKTLKEDIEAFEKKDLILIYQPVYHPAVVFVRSNYSRVLKEIGTNQDDIKSFQQHFNNNIDERIAKEFGDDLDKHINETEKYRLKDNEVVFLSNLIENGKIGFTESEELKYEQTYAEWRKVSKLRETEPDDNGEMDREKDLKPIENLIEEYFGRHDSNNLESILFIIADFGKGKSVFMKHHAAKLAKAYLSTYDGYFPVYLNLREFSNYSSDTKLGVIGDYLETKYSIKIDDEYFRKKKYFFLIDSLDESGDLNNRSITKVINSVKNIQNIDKSKYKTNRIVITSRPFDEGLSSHLTQHDPFTVVNSEKREVPQFINVYGFTKQQVNDWLFDTFSKIPHLSNIHAIGFAKEILESVEKGVNIDIYQQLLENKTLSKDELRRPIFAYMIYQLIINNVDFLAVGKLGIYLSFLNLLTKDAKHIHDINYRVDLKEEFVFRNVLQATASLWMHERHKGKQGMLNKADICRVLEGKNDNEKDNEILERFVGGGIIEIQFLSHSYFGENDNVLHFQHQSFAEILLAEYYLKVFIKFALDQDVDIEEAREKLILGEPTEQTMSFLKEMLILLRDTAVDSISTEVLEKRKLLFPLMASLSTNKHNRLFCNELYYSWFNKCEIGDNQTEYPLKSLENWCISGKTIEKILTLAQRILSSKHIYLPTQVVSRTSLFNREIVQLQNQELNSLPPYIDKWIALSIGNVLYNQVENIEYLKLFNRDYKINFVNLLQLIRSWNFYKISACPDWARSFFIGLDMSDNEEDIDLGHYNFDTIDFSYSYFRHIDCWGTNWSRCHLVSCTFDNVRFITCLMYGTIVNDIIEIKNDSEFANCELSSFGIKIFDVFQSNNPSMTSYNRFSEGKFKTIAPPFSVGELNSPYNIFQTLEGFLVYGLKKSYFKFKDIESWFSYENEEAREIFRNQLQILKQYETPSKRVRSKNLPLSVEGVDKR